MQSPNRRSCSLRGDHCRAAAAGARSPATAPGRLRDGEARRDATATTAALAGQSSGGWGDTSNQSRSVERPWRGPVGLALLEAHAARLPRLPWQHASLRPVSPKRQARSRVVPARASNFISSPAAANHHNRQPAALGQCGCRSSHRHGSVLRLQRAATPQRAFPGPVAASAAPVRCPATRPLCSVIRELLGRGALETTPIRRPAPGAHRSLRPG